MTLFCWRIVHGSDAFPQDFSYFLVQSSLTTTRVSPDCAGLPWRRLVVVGLGDSGGRGWRRSIESCHSSYSNRSGEGYPE